jgi:ATP adenylyltransferase
MAHIYQPIMIKELLTHGGKASIRIVERIGDEYRLTVDPSLLSLNQREELVRLCDEMVRAYMEKRGSAVYDHRRAALGYLSGSLRYEILRRAGFRCELCGVPAMAAGITGKLWEMADMVKVLENWEALHAAA